jgi:uncharacterized protein (UPF0276 family)
MTDPAEHLLNASCVLDPLPVMGIGLSTDLYFPVLGSLLDAFVGTRPPQYLEIFRGRTSDLAHARSVTVPGNIRLAYHGDALWYTQSDFPDNPAYHEEIRRANRHLDALEAPWMIHECAHKALLGRTFGVYLPPVLSERSAAWSRKNALQLLSRLNGRALLVEIPPFPFFSLGDLSVGAFFRAVVQGTGLGLGLDIGHALTAYRIGNPSPEPYGLAEWLALEFPLEHVVEIHVGGMEILPDPDGARFWDDHSRPIPGILWQALDAVLDLCPLPRLKGVALEVDNKEIPMITAEFDRFRRIVERRWPSATTQPIPSPLDNERPRAFATRDDIEREYDACIRAILSECPGDSLVLRGHPGSFRERFLPEDVWRFGGHIPDLFPRSLALIARYIPRPKNDFVAFFHSIPMSDLAPYDYLRTKVNVFGLWVESLIQNQKLPHDATDEIRELTHDEGRQILADQEKINGDPVSQEPLQHV